MRKKSKPVDLEAIAKTFRDLGLDDPELRRRLQELAKLGIGDRQLKRRDLNLVTRDSTAPIEGDHDAQLESAAR